MGEILSEIDAIGFDIFGLSNLDKAEIDSASVFASAEVEDLDPDADEKETESDQQDDKFDLLSWGVGVAFGQLRYPTCYGRSRLFGRTRIRLLN